MRRTILMAMGLVLLAMVSCEGVSRDDSAAQVAEDSVVAEATELSQEAEAAPQAATSAGERQVVLLDFYATWCGPCRQQSPVIEKLQQRHAGNLTVRRIDVDEQGALAEQYRVEAIPTLVFLVDGKEVKRFVGLTEMERLEAALKDYSSSKVHEAL